MAHAKPAQTVTVTRDGPYLVKGDIPLSRQTIGADADGKSQAWNEGEQIRTSGSYSLCRCGHSRTKPFCDGSHAGAGFDGTETARREPYLEQAGVLDGPVLMLTDVENLCAFARFCDPNGKVWEQVGHTDDPSVRETFVKQVNACPSGRLVAWDKETQKPIENPLPVSIALIEDPVEQCAGPLWLRGGIQVIGADGFAYEVRNRVTLCRCGQSQNKPFCDGAHASVHFKDE